ncbi:hypothetical protein EYF80_050668 [Liparis tanakae]|uniref:Uncharacterized protein n=1 Tax=Liparis tanakae TaxID=230148 RepID=A0A4Z2FFH0_9TELE|nr:hypothetical protein EYF80_050668 [Liparis tanakae]
MTGILLTMTEEPLGIEQSSSLYSEEEQRRKVGVQRKSEGAIFPYWANGAEESNYDSTVPLDGGNRNVGTCEEGMAKRIRARVKGEEGGGMKRGRRSQCLYAAEKTSGGRDGAAWTNKSRAAANHSAAHTLP